MIICVDEEATLRIGMVEQLFFFSSLCGFSRSHHQAQRIITIRTSQTLVSPFGIRCGRFAHSYDTLLFCPHRSACALIFAINMHKGELAQINVCEFSLSSFEYTLLWRHQQFWLKHYRLIAWPTSLGKARTCECEWLIIKRKQTEYRTAGSRYLAEIVSSGFRFVYRLQS